MASHSLLTDIHPRHIDTAQRLLTAVAASPLGDRAGTGLQRQAISIEVSPDNPRE